MKGEVANDGETRGENTSMGYVQRALGATLIIWLSLVVVNIAAFGLSESLRVAGVERNENVLDYIPRFAWINPACSVALTPIVSYSERREMIEDSDLDYLEEYVGSLLVLLDRFCHKV